MPSHEFDIGRWLLETSSIITSFDSLEMMVTNPKTLNYYAANINIGELVKRCRLFRGDSFRSRPRIDRIVRHIG